MATAHTERLVIVVAAGDVPAANDAAVAAVGEAAGRQTFVLAQTGLVPRGSPEGTAPTHAWCAWSLTGPERAALLAGLQPLVTAGACRVYDGSERLPARDRKTPDDALNDRNLERSRATDLERSR